MRKNEMRRWERSERWESIFRAGCGRKPLSVQLIFLVTIDLHSTWPRGNPQRRPAPAPHAGGHRNRLEGLAASGKKQDDVLGAMGIDFFDLVVVGCGLVCRRRLGSTFSSLAGPSGEARGALARWRNPPNGGRTSEATGIGLFGLGRGRRARVFEFGGEPAVLLPAEGTR